MEYLISQLALYLGAIGLLGLVLGWWLGHGSSKRGARSVAQLQERAETADAENEELALEAGRLGDQLASARIEAEKQREETQRAAADLAEAQEALDEERQRVASFEPLLAKRDSRIEELRSEVAAARSRASSLQSEQGPVQEASERLKAELAAALARSTELETAAIRTKKRLADLEGEVEAGREAAVKAESSDQLAASELQIWKERNRDQDEALDEATRLLEEANQARERAVAELASLRRRLETIEVERESHDMAAGAARKEIEDQRQLLRERDDRIRALEASSGSVSEYELEIEGLRGELAASVRRVDELRQRAETAEVASAAADRERNKVANELEALISAPLVDVDRMATVKPVSLVNPAGNDRSRPAKPELLDVPHGAADELQRIRGIGEVIEQTLNEIGVYHFRQIARWSESDVQWVAAHIDTFPDRILRDGWREQAAELDSQPREA